MFGGGTTTLVFMGMIILVFWLFFIRPQTKKQKDQKKFIEDCKEELKW
jgi:preprotein translocase subunit YajC